jgi:hypothetical protein
MSGGVSLARQDHGIAAFAEIGVAGAGEGDRSRFRAGDRAGAANGGCGARCPDSIVDDKIAFLAAYEGESNVIGDACHGTTPWLWCGLPTAFPSAIPRFLAILPSKAMTFSRQSVVIPRLQSSGVCSPHRRQIARRASDARLSCRPRVANMMRALCPQKLHRTRSHSQPQARASPTV